MITNKATKAMISEWKDIWLQYKNQLKPNRKSGIEMLNYLKSNYILTDNEEQSVIDDIAWNITHNLPYAEKLPEGISPNPKVFFLENLERGVQFYKPENQDSNDLWGKEITKIIVGIDLVSGYYMVEGSTMLWDELCAFRGIDELDLQNYVCVAEYIKCLKRFGKLNNVIAKSK